MKFVKTLKSRKGEIENLGELENILSEHSVKLAYLFGSHSRREITKFSDVDIAVLFEEGSNKQMEDLRLDLIELLGRRQ